MIHTSKPPPLATPKVGFRALGPQALPSGKASDRLAVLRAALRYDQRPLAPNDHQGSGQPQRNKGV